MTKPKRLRLKVYGGLLMDGRFQRRFLVAATSQRAGLEILQRCGHGNLTMNHFKHYFSETGNLEECSAAMKAPGRVLKSTQEPALGGGPFVDVGP